MFNKILCTRISEIFLSIECILFLNILLLIHYLIIYSEMANLISLLKYKNNDYITFISDWTISDIITSILYAFNTEVILLCAVLNNALKSYFDWPELSKTTSLVRV